MEKVSYDTLEKWVRNHFTKARSPQYGMNDEQSTGYTLVEFERIAENSELEHLIVNLALGKLLMEEQFFDEEIFQDLVNHQEKRTPLRYKNELDETEYTRLVDDLTTVISDWR